MVIVSNEWIKYGDEKSSLTDSNVLMMSSSAPGPGNNNQSFQVIRIETTTDVDENAHSKEWARMVLICEPNSHPFQTRNILLEPNVEYKVGRSIARGRVCENNAIFDCKVLSRNHAVLWYNDGKFYVKDTKSSNGTFINDRKITQSESEELSSGDVVKFGVDVIENSRKEVHGCIIACVKLYMPDGRESISINNSHRNHSQGNGIVSLDELHRLHHYMQESMQREKNLEARLIDIQTVLDVTRKNSNSCWQSMIDEDRLLNRIDILQNKLQFLQKNSSENQLRDEILKLQDEKIDYQNSAKEALRKVYQERGDAMQKLSVVQRELCSNENECSLLREELLNTQQNLQDVNSRLLIIVKEFNEYKEQSDKSHNEAKLKHDTDKDFEQLLKEKEEECEKYKQKLKDLLGEKPDLVQKTVEKSKSATNDENEDDTSETSKTTIMKWLENSDINQDEESKLILNAICNASDSSDEEDNMFDEKCSKLSSKLQLVQKNLDLLESEIINETEMEADNEKNLSDPNSIEKTDIKDENEDNSNNDGNQNTHVKHQDSPQLIKSSVSLLRESLLDVMEQMVTIKRQETIIQKETENHSEAVAHCEKEFINSENEVKDELEINYVRDQSLQEIDTLNDKINHMQNEIDLLKDENNSLVKVIEENEMNRKSLEIVSICSNTPIITDEILPPTSDIVDEYNENDEINNSLKFFDEVIKEDLAAINDDAVQQEEELILYKEKYDSILHENLKLKRDINNLNISITDCNHTFLKKMLTCAVVIFAIILYYVFSNF